MSVKGKLHSILSLSAASAALFHSVVTAKGTPTDENFLDVKRSLDSELNSKTDQLILKPAHQDELLRMYAGHHSHSSHASHSSHYSGSASSHASHASHYSGAAPLFPGGTPAKSYAAPSAPTPNYKQPVQASSTSVITPQLNPTNKVVQTNALDTSKTAQPGLDRDKLKKGAAQGSSAAQYALAIRYLNGWDGLEKNQEKARLLFELAALQGDEDAKKKLEEMKSLRPAEKLEESEK